MFVMLKSVTQLFEPKGQDMKEFRMTQARLIASIATGALVGSIAGSVGMSFADNLATTSSILDNGLTIPYDGARA